jgi:hypothetical protein
MHFLPNLRLLTLDSKILKIVAGYRLVFTAAPVQSRKMHFAVFHSGFYENRGRDNDPLEKRELLFPTSLQAIYF